MILALMPWLVRATATSSSSNRPYHYQALQAPTLDEDEDTFDMVSRLPSDSEGSVPAEAEVKGFHDATVTNTRLFSRTEGRTTFETSSLESYYKPIDSYEGLHRYDPEFQWEPKEEKRLVRKVGDRQNRYEATYIY